jgi:TolB-like protein/DNA-binding winged helix-turn-helix (wHTH) protein/Tfp pilus assembly protein PilF
MALPRHPSRQVHFGAFELDLQTAELRNNGHKFTLQDQPFQVLTVLLEHPGRLVTRGELKKKLWPSDTFVDFDHGLNKAVNRLREALDDSAENPRFIETLPRKGYRFIGPLETVIEHPANGQNLDISETAVPINSRPSKLKIVAAGVLGIALIVGAAGWLAWKMAWKSRSSAAIRSIAVLPLENLSGDASQDYFADGMTDELITNLGQMGSIRVTSRTSVMQYKRVRKPLPQVARELSVDAVVEGTVLRSGDHIRITAQLIEARTDKHLWAESYQGDLRDILRLQNQVAMAIASQIRIKLTPQVQGAVKTSRAASPEAYEAYWRGEYFLDKLTPESLQKATDYFKDAIAKDPDYVAAYDKLSATYQILGNMDALPKEESRSKAELTTNKALALDPSYGPAHAGKGWEALLNDLDFITAGAEFQRAAELNPNAVQGHEGLADYYAAVGQMDQAIVEIERAREVDPLSFIVNSHVCRMLFFARRFDEALAQCKANLDLDPNPPRSLWQIGGIYAAKGMYTDATSIFLQAFERAGFSSERMAALKRAEQQSGWHGMWKTALKFTDRDYGKLDPFGVAVSYTYAGDKDQALTWLEHALDDRSFGIVWLGVDPTFDSLRSDPRFQNLLRRMNFPQ